MELALTPQAMLKRMAHYNRWANGRLYAAVETLPEGEYKKTRPAFFKSIHGTLNHLLLGDRIWRSRIVGEDYTPQSLDTELYGDFADLGRARDLEDARIIDLAEDLDNEGLGAMVEYKSVQGDPYRNSVAEILQHMFNHQTHHRGQVHDMLAQTDVAPPPLDLMFYVRELQNRP